MSSEEELPPTAGERLIEELTQPKDSYSVTKLIERAGQAADWLEKLDDLINGKRSAWMRVRVTNDDVLEVRIESPMREARQLTTELRHLLGEIHRQRAGIPMDPDDDDDAADV